MLTWLKSLFRQDSPETINSTWTPETVEQRIEQAGRAEVFAEARRLGWGFGSEPPIWVWGTIANDIIAPGSLSSRACYTRERALDGVGRGCNYYKNCNSSKRGRATGERALDGVGRIC